MFVSPIACLLPPSLAFQAHGVYCSAARASLGKKRGRERVWVIPFGHLSLSTLGTLMVSPDPILNPEKSKEKRMTTKYHASKGRGKGQWWPIRSESQLTASFTCPRCGKEMVLGREIDADGTVSSSSVKCPYGCGFHAMLILEGWKER